MHNSSLKHVHDEREKVHLVLEFFGILASAAGVLF